MAFHAYGEDFNDNKIVKVFLGSRALSKIGYPIVTAFIIHVSAMAHKYLIIRTYCEVYIAQKSNKTIEVVSLKEIVTAV